MTGQSASPASGRPLQDRRAGQAGWVSCRGAGQWAGRVGATGDLLGKPGCPSTVGTGPNPPTQSEALATGGRQETVRHSGESLGLDFGRF